MSVTKELIGTIPIKEIKQEVNDFIEEVKEDNKLLTETFLEIDDPEGRMEIGLDSEEKIVRYRKSDGTLVENVGVESPKINTNSLLLSVDGMTEFQKALKDSGFIGSSVGDWSDYITNDGDNPLLLPEPRCALINIIGDVDLTKLSKKGYPDAQKDINYKVPVEVEYWDMQGNYFKKWAEISAQGNSSMMFPLKNIAMDLFDNKERENSFTTKIGKWVAQDSYHFKAFYSDFFKGIGIVAYKIAMLAQKTRGIYKDVSWKEALIDESKITDLPLDYEISDLTLQTNNEARCIPDGFPVIIYHNGEFYGIFTLCLKKHRDNYHMNKVTAEHIHLDGEISNATIFDGIIDWTAFEIRNPKNLYYKEPHDGIYEYDVDIPGQFEIADQITVDKWIADGLLPNGTPITNKIEKNLKKTAKVHTYIEQFAARWSAINAATGVAEKKSFFEMYFSADNLIDYLLINMALGDGDGFGPNWQWTTWDGKRWFVNLYDKDNTGGQNSKGFFIVGVPDEMYWYGSRVSIMKFIQDYYTDELKARWEELVNIGIFTTSNFMSLLNDWMDRIGYNNFYRHYKEKWVESPCCRDPRISKNWKLVSINYAAGKEVITYDDTKTYNIGDICQIAQENYNIIFECVVDGTLGIFPCGYYNLTPHYLGFFDSIWRIEKYFTKRLSSVTSFIKNLNS